MRPGHSPTLSQIKSRNRISAAISVLRLLGDPSAEPVLKETMKFWETLYPSPSNDNFTRECSEAFLGIQNAEHDRRRKNGLEK
jgi:hypothetical protein